MTTNRPLRVFLCHSSNDKPAVRELYQKLTELGIDAWLDEKKLLPGQNWEVEIPKAVKKADAVIVCLSKKSITKEGYVQKEILFALDVAQEKPERTIYIIPAKIQECKLPERLNKFHSVNLFEPHGLDFLLQSLNLRAKSLKIKFAHVNSIGRISKLTRKAKNRPIQLTKKDKKQERADVSNNVPKTSKNILDQAERALNHDELHKALQKFHILILEGNYLEEIIHDLKELLHIFPFEVEIWQTLGNAYMRANRFTEAIDAYNNAEELHR